MEQTNDLKERLLPPNQKKEPKKKIKGIRKSTTIPKVLLFAFPMIWTRASCCSRTMTSFAFFALISSRIVKVTSPIALKYAVDTLTIARTSLSDITSEQLISSQIQIYQAITSLSIVYQEPLLWITLYIIARFASSMLQQLQQFFFAPGNADCRTGISSYVIKHLHDQPLQFHLNRETGKVLRTVSRGAKSFGVAINMLTFQVFPIFIETGLTMSVFLFAFKYYFAIIGLITITSYMGATYFLQEWRNGLFRAMKVKDNIFNQHASDSLLNYETVKYFNAEDHEQRRINKDLRQFKKASIKNSFSQTSIGCVQQTVMNIGLSICLILMSTLIYQGSMEVGDFVMINAYMLQIFTPLNRLGNIWRNIKESMIDIDMVFQILEKNESIPQPENPVTDQFKRGTIEFRNVSFTYDLPDIEYPHMILKNVSFTVEPGTQVAIVGPTGSGKSTIMRLLYRFYDVTQGCVTIDGVDVREVLLHTLREIIAIVPQDCVLFNDDIYYNIAYGGASEEGHFQQEERIENAARRAKIYHFIENLRQKWKTKVGERGLRLSGGQKQRVAIARALLKRKALIYCFDQATSALDTATEREVQEAINEVSIGATSLIIAHRLSTVMDADKIIVLQDGQIVEQGRHYELLQIEDGVYRKLWSEQLNKLTDENTEDTCIEEEQPQMKNMKL